MGSQFTSEAPTTQSGRQSDRQTAELLCPVQIAHPHVTPESKTCDNHCRGIRRVKDHINKHHKCNCPGQPEPCGNPMHLGPTVLGRLRTIRHLNGETLGEQWGRIFKILYPNRTDVPAPYVPSAGDLKAIARAPPPGFTEQLANRIQNVISGRDEGVHLLLANVHHFIDLVCQLGVHPDSQAAAPETPNRTAVFTVCSMPDDTFVSTSGDSDMNEYLNLEGEFLDE